MTTILIITNYVSNDEIINLNPDQVMMIFEAWDWTSGDYQDAAVLLEYAAAS